jgi:hypothetical protein
MAVGDDDVIDSTVVSVGSALERGFKEKLQRKVDQAMRGVKANVPIVADASGFNRSAKEALAKQAGLRTAPTYKVRLVADATGFGASARAALRKAGQVTARVKLEAGGTSGGGGARGRGDSDARAEAAAKKAEAAAKKAERILYSRIREPVEKFEAAEQVAHQAAVFRLVNSFEDALSKAHLAAFEEDKRRIDRLHALALAEEKRRADAAEDPAVAAAKAANDKILADRKANLTRIRGLDEVVQAAEVAALGESQRRQQQATRVAEQQTGRRIAAAQRERAEYKKALTGPRIIDWGGRGIRPMNLLYGSVAALSPALIAMASSAVQASTAVAALGSAAVGTGLLVTGLTVAFSGLTGLLAQRKSVLAQQATEDANSAATAIANAETELRNRNNLLDAVAAELKAERDLHDARRDAARDLVNLRQKVAELQAQQREDTVSVAEAEANKQKVYRSYFATALDRARADADLSNAKVRQTGNNLDRNQAKEDLADSVKKGVTKADKVVDAQESLRQARARAAEARLTKANQGITATANKATSAEAQLQKQLEKASPALRDMYKWVVDNEKQFDTWGRSIQQAFLPGFTDMLRAISDPGKGGGTSTLQFFIDDMNELGGIVSKYAGRFGAFTNSPLFRAKFATIGDNNARSLENLGHAAETLQKPLLRIVEAASPLLVKFTGELDDFAGWLDKVIEKADRSGSLSKWFEDSGVQLDHWIGIAKNILDILGNIFSASIPAGGSLVERFEKFTGTLAKWTGSAEGQREMTAFFTVFKNLPYGEIAKLFTNAVQLFLAYRTVKWAVGNPFWTALGVLAASNPAGAAAFIGGITSGIQTVLGYMAEHPAQTAALLTLLAYAKLKKTFGLDIKIPALESIKSALTSRFKSLEGVFGGSLKTGTMTVQAGVVNVYGAGGLTTGGKPGTATVVPGGATKPASGVKVAGGAAAIAGAVVGSTLLSSISTEGKSDFQKGLIGGAQGALSGALAGALFGPVGAVIGGVLGGAAGAYAAHSGKVTTAADRERELAGLIFADQKRRKEQGLTLPTVNAPEILQRGTAVDDYVRARKESIKARVEQARAVGGEKLAEKVLNDERAKSVNTLSQMLVGFQYTAPAAQKAAMQIFGTAEAAVQLNGSAGKSAELAKVMGDEIALAGVKVGDVTKKLDAFSKTWIATLEVNGEEIVFPSLREALIYQSALTSGTSLDEARRRMDMADDITQRMLTHRDAQKMAAGGRVPGSSPHSKADNIPAMLTANEFVQPVDVVKHYGVGYMEALRQKKIPRYAAGGRVAMPFKVDVSKTKIPSPQLPPAGLGQITGDADVASIAEATARAMGASDKQLVALVEAGLVESGMRNLNYGDRDSVGFLQQRPSQGWGSVRQIMNVAYATRKFVEKAMRMDRAVFTSGQLAQKVQVSAFPERYDQRYADAVAILNSAAPFLTGYNPSTLDGRPYAGKIPKGLGKVFNVSASIMSAILAAHNAFPGARVTSSYRPGSITRSGNLSYHARNPSRAADFAPPSMGLFEYFAGRYPNARELIYSPAGKAQIRNGRSHYYTGGVRADHFDHVHLALAQGGLVKPRVRKYDSGGTLPPGYTLAFNGTGRNETVRTERQEKQVTAGPMRLHRSDIALLATNIAQASSMVVAMDGRVVAEANNRNTYLPPGV